MFHCSAYVVRNCRALRLVDADKYDVGLTVEVKCWRLKVALADSRDPLMVVPVVNDCRPLPLTSYSTRVFESKPVVGDRRATKATGDSDTARVRDVPVTNEESYRLDCLLV